MGRLLTTAAVAASVAIARAQTEPPNHCDEDYDCIYSYTDRSGYLYEFDFRGLCNEEGGYSLTDANNHTYNFNLCGTTARECIPAEYTSRYAYGAAMQYWDSPPPCNLTAPECWDPYYLKPRCCTAPCEVLGVGTPQWTVQDYRNPATGGINLTYTGVIPEPNDKNVCPINKKTGAMFERQVTFQINCDQSITEGIAVDFVGEPAPCEYLIQFRTAKACGCAPQCAGKFCGDDGCGGFCSGATFYGGCPYGQGCSADGTCCRSDCNNRDCGDDGCGGSCGSCGADETCSPSRVCVSNSKYIPSAQIIYQTDSSGLAGAFFGGILSAVACAGALMFFTGPGRQYFDAIRTQGLAAAMTGASADKSSQSLMAGTGASASTGSSGSKFGGYGSSSSGGYGSASSGGGVYGSKSTDL